jgi:uncharacterized phage infection (PIP) family protein YhgE
MATKISDLLTKILYEGTAPEDLSQEQKKAFGKTAEELNQLSSSMKQMSDEVDSLNDKYQAAVRELGPNAAQTQRIWDKLFDANRKMTESNEAYFNRLDQLKTQFGFTTEQMDQVGEAVMGSGHMIQRTRGMVETGLNAMTKLFSTNFHNISSVVKGFTAEFGIFAFLIGEAFSQIEQLNRNHEPRLQ